MSWKVSYEIRTKSWLSWKLPQQQHSVSRQKQAPGMWQEAEEPL